MIPGNKDWANCWATVVWEEVANFQHLALVKVVTRVPNIISAIQIAAKFAS
jgi:hypothetical protein